MVELIGLISGRVSPKSSFTVVNANDTFIQYQPEADDFIKKELVRRGINLVMNTKLNEIKKVEFCVILGWTNGSFPRFKDKYCL